MKRVILIAFLLFSRNAISQNIIDSTGLKKDSLTGVYITPDIEVSDYVQKTAFDKIIEMSYSLSGKNLQRNLNTTLASTIKNEMGMSMRSMGPAPSRPVFRGLSGERISISEDGIKTNDLSSTSPDHSVALETFTVDKIEVLRGPKLLTKSPTNVGAVINTIRNEIPQELPDKFNIIFGTYGETVNSGFSSSLVVKAPLSDFSLRGEISNRNTGKINYATLLPIYATEGVPAILTGFETQLEIKPFMFLQLEINASYTYGKINSTGTPLPSIPPFKIISTISYKRNNFLFGVLNESASEQLRIDTFEEPTDGYSIFGVFSQYIPPTGKFTHNLSANIDNIINTEYRNHLSRVKSIMPEHIFLLRYV